MCTRIGSVALAFILLLLFSGVGYSTTLYVPSGYSTIQAAINAASANDVIVVSQGTYNEN